MTNFKSFPILYVDDSKANRIVTKYSLAAEFTVVLAESGAEALQILANDSFAVLLTDQRMPGMTGVELSEQAASKYPDVIRVLITAYSDLDTTVDAINRGQVSRFLKKPWSEAELIAVLKESIETYRRKDLVKNLQEQLLGADRAMALSAMASGIIHDIQQPLACLTPAMSVLRTDITEFAQHQFEAKGKALLQEMMETIDDADSGLLMLKELIISLVDFVSDKPRSAETLDVKDVLNAVVAITRSTVRKQARFVVDLPETEMPMTGHSTRLSRLFVNLIINSTQALEGAPPGGHPREAEVKLTTTIEPDHYVIFVGDNGEGIPSDVMEHIFTPFFSTKAAAGTGLGLAIAKEVAEQHDGSLTVTSSTETGTQFEVRLPRPR